MSTYRVPPMHDHGREVRGASLTCDECGDQLELRAHGLGVRGDRAKEVALAMSSSVHVVALALGWLVSPTRANGSRHTCPACRARVAALVSRSAP